MVAKHVYNQMVGLFVAGLDRWPGTLEMLKGKSLMRSQFKYGIYVKNDCRKMVLHLIAGHLFESHSFTVAFIC